MPAPKVLVVTENAEIAEALRSFLRPRGVEVHATADPAKAKARFENSRYLLAIVDLDLPDQMGFRVCELARGTAPGKGTRVVVLTNRENTDEKRTALQMGVLDYLNKPIAKEELTARLVPALRNGAGTPSSDFSTKFSGLSREQMGRLKSAVDSSSDMICLLVGGQVLEYANAAYRQAFGMTQETAGEAWLAKRFVNPNSWKLIRRSCEANGSWRGEVDVRSDDRVVPVLCRADRFPIDSDKPAGIVLTMTDISQRKRLEQDLIYLANHDPLTGLYNRRYFGELLDDAVERAKNGEQGYLLYLDLDNFKVVNDSAGHAAGDILLQDITQLLRKHTRSEDSIGRFGGDEFTILLHGVDYGTALSYTKRIVRLLDDYRFVYDGKSYSASASVGLAAIDGSATGEDILAQVDSACYTVKARGRNGYALFKPNTAELQQLSSEANWSILIKDALREGRFEVWLQPIRNVRSNVNTYYEVLLRMRDRRGNLIMPGAFMPAAERFGNMHQLDQYVVRSSIELLQAYSQLKLSINLSAKSLNDPNLPGFLERLLRESGVLPSRASFEITETAMIQNLAHARQLIKRIKALGCKFALDDFGAGASSMVYLRDLPVDYLKIDGSFIKCLEDDHVNRAIVKSINDIAHILGKQTIAEFVSNAAIYEVIQELGIDYAQGFHVCVPAPPTAFFSRQRGIQENTK